MHIFFKLYIKITKLLAAANDFFSNRNLNAGAFNPNTILIL